MRKLGKDLQVGDVLIERHGRSEIAELHERQLPASFFPDNRPRPGATAWFHPGGVWHALTIFYDQEYEVR